MGIFSEPLSIAQTFGLVSFALGLSTFYQKDDRRLKIVMFILNLNHLTHYLLMGSVISALSSLLSVLRTGTALYLTPNKVLRTWAAGGFILASSGFGIAIADSIWELWPIFGTAIGSFAVFMLQGIKMRLAFLAGACCWLINNVLIGSIGGTLLELSVITVNVITIIRLLREQKYKVLTS
ncbi:YgjV family protein [Vibrio fujianensis]|uniref:YgjV family protein n=1 Tax=Vibrio fujianensis TaxID=1974215 RepID=UPI000C163A63|nr:YgjV family protein [Vibrio fujianensis]